MPKFKIGDRVLCTDRVDKEWETKGLTGTIVEVLSKDRYSVEFDQKVYRKNKFYGEYDTGHDCDRMTKPGYGLFVFESMLELCPKISAEDENSIEAYL